MLGSKLMPAPWITGASRHCISGLAIRVLAVEPGEKGGVIVESKTSDNNEGLGPEAQTAKAAILAECDRLAAAGITFVAVHFDGYGDDGTTEEVKCYSSDWYAWGEHEPVNHDTSHLQEHFEALVQFGYENDCGGFGDVVLNVSARKLTIERNDRFEDYTTTTYEA
jgi:hypothetical protein